ncbi:TRAP-type C4-dicarboxylate transport system, small permease component [Paracoccus thiocyanatus]|uniref:TRAP transporter small permease protein n=1 Tax=Paracoccus thiocyanatus TaxID=34006 RepID=A0A1N6V6Q3_9RHOB|nr:TRAP transporter small permease [Paracoccus thiocyanatus]SIQ73419.1 TRAP-type C4-dicarboxylate transport system, small permease component [Paracoccus thiocyanatus]
MTKDLLHIDSLDDVIGTSPIRPVPEHDRPPSPIHSGLGPVYAAERGIAWLMRVIMFLAIISLGLLMAAQVFMRYVISAPFLGIEELAPLLAVWVYFLGMAYCSRERDHIEGGMMTLVIKNPRLLTALRLLGSAATLITIVIFMRFAWDFVAFNYSVGRRSTYMRLPKVLWDVSLLIGLALMTFYAALQCLAEARALFITRGRGK